ncbi:MAG: von Willebrand factor type domain protein [Rhizorhabdus sp.]|nr:von Willebrand factor type domain protein [Rhizorhabdus sp.]
MKRLASLFGLILLFALAACGQSDQAGDDPNAFHILAGSELKDVEAQVVEKAHKAGVSVRFEYAGTLDIIDRINRGEKIDAVWIANGAYAGLAMTAKPAASTKIMYSQILPGVKPAVAQALGWDSKAPSWAEIAAAAAAGKFHYAMTNPTASNSGLSALVATASSIAGKGEGLGRGDVDAAALTGFLKGQALTAGSSGWLAEAYAREADRLDGMINYESVLISQNPGLRMPLTILYPRDGAVTSDYPLLLTNPARRAEYDKLVALLLSKPEQAYFAGTGRRPVDSGVALPAGMRADPAIDLPFPARIDAVDALLFAYLDKLRRPVRSWFVLDRSGSMEGERMTAMKAAMRNLVEGDETTLAGRFARLADRERTTLISFSTSPDPAATFAIDRANPAGRQALLAAVNGLAADAGTGIYDAIAVALRQAIAEQPSAPGRVYSIVLMTDGDNNEGMDADDFARLYATLPPAKRAVRIFPILFGEGNEAEMKKLATLTGGRTFDARGGDLATVFRDIRGYQ